MVCLLFLILSTVSPFVIGGTIYNLNSFCLAFEQFFTTQAIKFYYILDRSRLSGGGVKPNTIIFSNNPWSRNPSSVEEFPPPNILGSDWSKIEICQEKYHNLWLQSVGVYVIKGGGKSPLGGFGCGGGGSWSVFEKYSNWRTFCPPPQPNVHPLLGPFKSV